MKTIKKLMLLILFILTLFNCKKDKLTNENTALIGTWTSISTVANCGFVVGQPYNPEFKLELIKKGRYKLYHSDKKIEEGRLLLKNGLVTFECIKRESELDTRKILNFNSDTLNIDRNGCQDDYVFRFVKN